MYPKQSSSSMSIHVLVYIHHFPLLACCLLVHVNALLLWWKRYWMHGHFTHGRKTWETKFWLSHTQNRIIFLIIRWSAFCVYVKLIAVEGVMHVHIPYFNLKSFQTSLHLYQEQAVKHNTVRIVLYEWQQKQASFVMLRFLWIFVVLFFFFAQGGGWWDIKSLQRTSVKWF